VEMSAAFKKYMKGWKGNEDKRAYVEGSRMDSSMRARMEQSKLVREVVKKSRGDQ